MTFYDFPAEHWDHIRTTNPIESAFATVRLRQRVTKGAGSRSKALLMVVGGCLLSAKKKIATRCDRTGRAMLVKSSLRRR